jgi:glyoxylase-like metal-dependent hydrolase (beta-lactamase superfamily II)
LPAWICATCGNHYPDSEHPPASCKICSDERQWVPPSGQRWTTHDELAAAPGPGDRADKRHSEFWEVEPGLTGVRVTPDVGIGQRALLVRTDQGNLLWDPPGFVDDEAIEQVRGRGGLRAVTASHPHFYGAMATWARAFGAGILVNEADASWVTEPDPAIRTWSGRLEVLPGVTLVQCGGHFPGSAVVHWADGAGGAGALLAGDTIFVTPGEDRLTFIWSAPNRLPLSEPMIRGILDAVRPFPFDRIYGGWAPTIGSGARQLLEASAERYIQFLRGEAP